MTTIKFKKIQSNPTVLEAVGDFRKDVTRIRIAGDTQLKNWRVVIWKDGELKGETYATVKAQIDAKEVADFHFGV
jgi:hypothetical protein